ncbi:MAG: hypothetical protein WCK60_00220 [Candidatus Nomurabacteria bacterium]
MYKGTIVAESLKDIEILNNIKVISLKETDDENVADRWHIYSVLVTDEEIDILEKQLKESWYTHFWNETKLIILFSNKKFICDINDKTSWQPAVDFGLSIGIPKEQLDFLMD